MEVITISCKHYEEDEFYLGAHLRLFPCCYLYDEGGTNDQMDIIYEKYGKDFNNLKYHSIEEIMNHEWFTTILKESFSEDHPLHLAKCTRSCGDGGKRKTQITRVSGV
jgi:hypothetical protein